MQKKRFWRGVPPVTVFLPDRDDGVDGVVQPLPAQAPVRRRAQRRRWLTLTPALAKAALPFGVGQYHRVAFLDPLRPVTQRGPEAGASDRAQASAGCRHGGAP